MHVSTRILQWQVYVRQRTDWAWCLDQHPPVVVLLFMGRI